MTWCTSIRRKIEAVHRMAGWLQSLMQHITRSQLSWVAPIARDLSAYSTFLQFKTDPSAMRQQPWKLYASQAMAHNRSRGGSTWKVLKFSKLLLTFITWYRTQCTAMAGNPCIGARKYFPVSFYAFTLSVHLWCIRATDHFIACL